MTQNSPTPSDATPNDLNTLLDALVAGKRAPEAGSVSDPDTCAAVHRLVCDDAAADVSATPSEQMLDQIWRNVMQPHAIIPTADNGFVPPQSARQKARLRAVPERPRSSRVQTLVSMGAVAAMLIVLIGAWWLGPGGNGSNGEQRTRLAAVTQDDSTPIATVPAATYVHPQPEMCTVAPLTVEEVMAIVTGDDTSAVATPVPMPELDADTYEGFRSLLSQYLGCGIFGDPFRAWAISSPDEIRAQLIRAPGWMPEEELRRKLEEMQAEVDSAPDSSAFDWTPAGNPAIPALPDVYDPSLVHVDEAGRVHVTIVWVTKDGQPPSGEYGFPIGAEDGMSEIVFIWDAEQGRWLIDGIVPAEE